MCHCDICATASQGIHATAQTTIIQFFGTAAAPCSRCRSPPLVYGGIPLLLLLGPLVGAPQRDVDQIRGVLHRQLIPALKGGGERVRGDGMMGITEDKG